MEKKNKKVKTWSQNDKIFLGILIPVLVLFFCFNTLPLIKGFYYGLTNFKGYGSYDFLVNVISLILALGLNREIRGKNALRGIYFVPNILGGLVVGYIFSFIFTYILPAVGETTGIGFLQNSMLANTKTAWIAIVIVGAWQGIAMNTIIYISGLQTVPEEVYEACMLDGARGWKKFSKITFPLIMPFFTINLVLCMKNALMVFDQIMSLTKGGPSQSTESISYLIYNNGMSGGQFGFQSANAFVFFVVIVVISFLQMKFLGGKEEQL